MNKIDDKIQEQHIKTNNGKKRNKKKQHIETNNGNYYENEQKLTVINWF